ncbi:MAG: GDSL-type esterase/lipase family protein [Candidatus Omnitrophota bacterium]
MRRIIHGVVTSFTAIVISIIIIEACLRIAGIFYSKELVAAKNINNGTFLVYCFGDSFTYGTGSENKKGYPEQLQELCEKQYPGEGIKVINFGIPGSNSKQALNYFKYILTSSGYSRPSVVILMTGMNDWWNIADNNKVLSYYLSHYRMNHFATKCCMVLLRSKIVKLLTICFVNKTTIAKTDLGSQLAIANSDEPGARERIGDEYLSAVRIIFEQNLNDFVNLARCSGIDIIFSQYPNGFIFDSSLEYTSKRLNITMVYNYEKFRKFISGGQLDEYFSSKLSYSHPNDKGYAIMAEEILTTLIRKKQI